MGKFKTSKVAIPLYALTVMALMASCSNSKFKLKGEIYGAEDKTVVLEKSGFNGEWIAIDSTKIDSKGVFSLKEEAPENPEIYRLALDGNYLYIPVDSAVNITLTASYAGFSSDFTMSGTESAEKMEKFEKMLAKAIVMPQDSMASFKRRIFTEVIYPGKGDIMSYYILTRMIDGRPLYDPADRTDAKYYAAVATAYKHYRPEDPRTALLEKIALGARRHINEAEGKQSVVEAPAVSIIDMEFPDINGRKIKLSDVTSQGRPTLLIFSMVAQQESPEINRAIASLYEKYKGRVNFYEVCLDPDITSWREAVKNIPWTAVIDYEGLQSGIAMQYNVSTLPAFFIYNGHGELSSRADGIQALEKELQKY